MSNFAIAQTASEYYLPLCKDNFLQFKTQTAYTGTDSGGWAFRTSHFSIRNSAIFNGKTYFLQKGYEVLDDFPLDTNVFHRLWIREDANGNILIGAFGMSGSDNPDSAYVLPMEGPILTNAYLNAGYSISMPSSANVTLTDSVISTNATVGSYTNCIQVRTTRKTNGVVDLVDDYFYAKNIGRVRSERLVPYYQVHEDKLMSHLAVDCQPTGITDSYEIEYAVSVFPNPATHYILFKLNVENTEALHLEIFNLMGQRLFSDELLDLSKPINVTFLNDGIYHYTMHTEKGNYFTGKLLIRR